MSAFEPRWVLCGGSVRCQECGGFVRSSWRYWARFDTVTVTFCEPCAEAKLAEYVSKKTPA